MVFIERRKCKRQLCNEPIEFLKITGRREVINRGLMVDKSDGGAGLTTDFPLLIGQPVIFRVKGNDEDIIYGIVCWSCMVNGLFRAGIRYIFNNKT